MISVLKHIEGDAINIVVAYRGKLGERGLKELVALSRRAVASTRKYRIVLHVFSDRDNLEYLEDLRPFILNNVVFSISIRSYELSREAFAKLLKLLEKSRYRAYVLLQRDLEDLAKDISTRNLELHII